MTYSAIVMFDSVDAAQPWTVDGWKSRDGFFYHDERTARYAGCTHKPCENCGEPAEKMYPFCAGCRAIRAQARWVTMPSADWDGVQMVYSETRERFYASPNDALDDSGETEDLDSLRIVLCDPQLARLLDTEDFIDELPEDGEAPDTLLAAIDAFNEAVGGLIVSWVPGNTRLKLDSTP